MDMDERKPDEQKPDEQPADDFGGGHLTGEEASQGQLQEEAEEDSFPASDPPSANVFD